MRINIDLIKKLRLKSGISIIECKNALIKSKGNIENAIMILKENEKIKANNKINNIAIRGIILTHVINNHAYLIEVNCETDFVEKHDDFVNFVHDALVIAHDKNIKDIALLKCVLEKKRLLLISKFNENIVIRRFFVLFGDNISDYLHHDRIGVILHASSKKNDLLKKVSMHIAASRPDFISRDDIPNSLIEQEKKIQLNIALRSGKSVLISKKIVHGRIEKFINDICLLEQNFIFDISKKVKDFLEDNHIKILQFARFELGEDI
ncbi:translation elongation factor Ts [Buchnera aphidicola]|uniref:translation elongation factor Ts n=1 Tax=Buchnera aphidicola TaxID=9 RepID=UPI00346431C8